MNTNVIVAIITSLGTLIGVIITVLMGNKITLYRIAQLESKVEKHNQMVERTYKLEEQVRSVNEKIDDIEKSKGNK